MRDAQGNVIAVYEIKKKNNVDSLFSKEFYIYGSQRLGYIADNIYLGKKAGSKVVGGNIGFPTMPSIPFPNPFLLPGTTSITPIYFGKKRYELNDWLGNVRVVINDKKTPVNSGTTTVSYFPQVINVRDYYSFGLEINERTYSYFNTKYRFSFNDKEDIEQRWYQDYGARYYHKALGRFISADPLIVKQKKYPWLSSYQFASNNPIQNIDVDGLEGADFKFDYPWSPQFIGGQSMDEKGKQTYFEAMQATFATGLSFFNPIENAALGFMTLKSIQFIKTIGKTISYALKYENISIKTAEAVNQTFRTKEIGKAKNIYDAYKKGTYVIEFTTTKEEKFVRVFKKSYNNQHRSWIMKESELYDEGGKMLTPEQIKNKFSLEYEPDMIVDVNIPKGTRMRTGIAAPVGKHGTKGGGQQFQLLGEPKLEWFQNPRELKTK